MLPAYIGGNVSYDFLLFCFTFSYSPSVGHRNRTVENTVKHQGIFSHRLPPLPVAVVGGKLYLILGRIPFSILYLVVFHFHNPDCNARI